MRRKLLSLLLVLSIIITLLPIQVFAVDTTNPFRDVKQGDWCYDAVQYVRINGFFSGTTRTTFSPNDTMTRGMFVTVLGRMAGVNPDNYVGLSKFADVPETAYFAPYVAWASKYGITAGTGDGKFSPYAYINRQQMAAFFARYFEVFGVDYSTGTTITTTPADIDSVSLYARDAVLKLWRTGLLNGDGVNFNPAGNATRAQGATICYRADQTVDSWYSEPGIPSTRVKLDPASGLPYGESAESDKPANTKPSNGWNSDGSSSGGTTTTTYYEVTFALGNGQTSIDLPAAKTYAAGTRIDVLPTPVQQDVMFLGWYYDAALTQPVGASDTVGRNMTLYAKTGELDGLSIQETPNYITVADVEPSFQLKLSGTNINIGDLTITQVSANNARVHFTVDADGNVTPVSIEDENGNLTAVSEWEPGHTYKTVLQDESPTVFVHEGEPQPATIRVFNIIVKKQEVQNLSLNDTEGGIKYIPKTDAEGVPDFEGLFTASLTTDSSGETKIETVNRTGTFTYFGVETLNVGDVVVVYEGKHPQQRVTPEEQQAAVIYVEITGAAGNTYTYKTAEAENVLFIPDVLPVSWEADQIPGDGNVLTADAGVFAFSGEDDAEMGLDADTTVDVGDFIAFYDGSMEMAQELSYKRITSVAEDNGVYTIRYQDATEDQILSSMDLYTQENKEITLTDGQIEEIEAAIAQQAIDSGFADAAAEYLAALALETDGFQELAGDFAPQSFVMTFADGTPVGEDDLSLMAEGRARITKKEIKPSIRTGWLKHFEKKTGVLAELTMNLVIEVDLGGGRKVEINLQAVFEQEVMINVNASGGAIWAWAFIFPHISDYRLNANIDIGTYTGIGITATAQAKGKSGGGFDWGAAAGNSAGDKIVNIGKQIKDLMDKKDKFLGQDLADGTGEVGSGTSSNSLAEQYSAMIKEADEGWFEIFRQEIFSVEGCVDPLHILCYGVSADFVVSATFYATAGMTFEYAAAKRYNFSVLLWSKKCTNNTVDLETPHYEFAFYAMGTLGVRAGVELELGVGLFSLKVDSVGVTAGAGASVQLWGYFYYHLQGSKNPSTGKYNTTSEYSGAMLIKIGTYLKITFNAQLFSSEKLTYQPTLYENQWPLLTVGSQENILGFAEKDDRGNDIQTEYSLAAVKNLTLPASTFSVERLNMLNGKISSYTPFTHFPWAMMSPYTVSMSDNHYTYNYLTNTVTINPKGLSVLPDCVMTIRWKSNTLAFSSRPIERKVIIRWSNPADMRYISFDSQGGSPVDQIRSYLGMAVTAPQNPSLNGYDFGGWYTDDACTTAFAFPERMPESFNGEKGVTVYAKWIPRNDTQYTVEHYRQELDGTYTLISGDTETLNGTTGGSAVVTPRTDGEYAHFTPKAIPTAQIAGDGTTVVRVYYDRNTYEVQFTYGAQSNGGANRPKSYTAKYGAIVYAPLLALKGYELESFDGIVPGTAVRVTGSVAYNALWTAGSAGYRVEHYLQNTDGSTYTLDRTETETGFTGAAAAAGQITVEGFTYNRTEPASAVINGDGSTVVRLYYDRNPHTLTWETGEHPVTGGTPGGTVLFGAAVTAPVSDRTDFFIEGWYETPDCTGAPVTVSAMPDRDLTLYAKWADARGNLIIYINRDGQGTQEAPVDYPADRRLTAPDPIDGYTFMGWTGTGIGDTPQRDYTIPEGTAGVLTFTAHWESLQHTITFDYGGISGGPASVETDAEGRAELPVPSYSNHTGSLAFAGWYTQPNGGTQVTDDTVFTEDQTLYAHWSGWDLTADGLLIVGDNAAMTELPWMTSEGIDTAIDIRSALILPGVTAIGAKAFEGCTGLTAITIPDSVTEIGDWTFHGCSSLTEIIIPDSVTAIGWGAFEGCTGLTEITIPDGVTAIDDWTFKGCGSLSAITIPGSVTAIGHSAFYGCTGLTEITIPDSVTEIGERAFDGCTGLTEITIPDGVAEIGDWAFQGCTGLTEITIPGSVTAIGRFAFDGCTGLTEITIPDGVTEIGAQAFDGCTGLTEIIIPDSVTAISVGAFYGCTGLTKIIIPDSVTAIGESAFDGCTGLTEIIIPDGVTAIDGRTFYGCRGLTAIIIPDSVTAIGDQAFASCRGLTEIIIPDSVTAIDQYAFASCRGLTEIIIPDSVTTISDGTFRWCTGLTAITIPDSVTAIGDSAFYNCSGLTDVYYSGTMDGWNNIEIGADNTGLTNAAIHCTDGDITL